MRTLLFITFLSSVLSGSDSSPYLTRWRGGDGNWIDTAKWTEGSPTIFREAEVGGISQVEIPPGKYSAAMLRVGTQRGDRVKVQVNGGHILVRQDSLIIGERSGSVAQFVLNEGSLEDAMDIFVGGATASVGRMNTSSLSVRGGQLIGLTLTVGEGLGSDSSLEILGSHSTGIRALEFVHLLAHADPGGKPAMTTLTFTLDEHGVTPITIGSRWHGLEIEHYAASRCRLHIALAAVPPHEDVTLISSHVPVKGSFDELPEGSEITAEYNHHVYRWVLSYKGGGSGNDLVLKNRSVYASSDPVTHVLPRPAIPNPEWWGHPVYPLAIDSGPIAFAGAEGYGASAKGGGASGRKVYVDTLDDSGSGSLRAAVSGAGPRVVVFRVGGTIDLKSDLVIRNPALTLDGSAAPAPGITLQRHGIGVSTHDVILKQIRIRIGDDDVHRGDPNVHYEAGHGQYALQFIDGAHDDIADHLSLSWSTNKILSTTRFSDKITIQWCILSESLNIDGHGYGAIAGGNRVTWHHNLFAHHFSRNPRFQGAVDADFRNNVVYDWGEKSAYGEFDRLNFAGNYFKPGPSTQQRPLLFHDGFESVAPHSLFLVDNVMEGNSKVTADNWQGTGFYFDRLEVAAATPFPAPPVHYETAAIAFQKVLSSAGATLPARDPIDERVVREVIDGSGRIIDSVSEMGASRPY